MTMKVKTRFTADEDVSSIARRIDENVRRMNKNMKRGFRESSKSALGFKDITKSILTAGIIQKGFEGIAIGVFNVVSEFVDFDRTLREAATRFSDIGAKSEKFNQKLKELKIAAREAAKSSELTPKQTAKGLDVLARAGFDSETSIKALKGQIDFAVATGEDFVFSTTVSTKLLGAFGLAVGKAAEKSKNLGRVNDVLAKLVNTSNVNLEETFDTMKLVGKVATSLGSDLEEVSAFTAVLGNSALDGSIAMTALRNLFLRTAAPTAESIQLFKALGLSFDNGTGKAKNMTKFLMELRDKLSKYSDIKQAAILEQLYGKQAITGVQTLLDEIPEIEKYKKSFKNATGEVAAGTEKIGESVKGKFLTLISSITEFGFKIIAPFEDDIKRSLESLTEFFRADPKPLVDAIREVITYFKELTKNITVEDVHKKINEIIADIKAFFIEAKDFFRETKLFIEKVNEVRKTFGFVSEKERRKGVLERIAELKPERQAEIEKAKQELLAKKIASQRRAALERSNRLGMIAREEEQEAERKAKEERAKALIPPDWKPDFKIDVTNQINAKNIEVDTTVIAPGTQGNAGVNLFF